MHLIIKILIQSASVFIASYILPGIKVESILTIIIVAIVLGIVNIFVKPLLVLLTLPLTVITFGLFILVINAVLVLLVGSIVPGFDVDGFWWALLFSIVVSLVSTFLSTLES